MTTTTRKNVFRSRISIPLLLFILFIFSLPLLIEYFQGDGQTNVSALAILLLALLLPCLLLLFSIRYQFGAHELSIRVLGLSFAKIPYHRIQNISTSNSWLSAPAAAFPRLRIQYGKNQFVLVSPTHQEQFIEQLLQENPSIQVAI